MFISLQHLAKIQVWWV